ncbi:unnamed protein product [Symbiodinium sp. KB8]|nr:unnamed protein product [Symbiodinium sp. KB8]
MPFNNISMRYCMPPQKTQIRLRKKQLTNVSCLMQIPAKSFFHLSLRTCRDQPGSFNCKAMRHRRQKRRSQRTTHDVERLLLRLTAPVQKRQVMPWMRRASFKSRGRDTNPQNWKSASNFLRLAEQKVEKTAQHPEIMEEQRLLQRTDLQLQAQAAVLRITAKKMHRRALQAFIQRREADASLELARATERRTRDARQVLGSLQRSSTPRGLQKALTRCVEATVAAFDAERRNAGTKSLTDLDREVARAMQSISRCRRLLLDMVKASPVGSTEPQGLGLGDESRKVFFEPGSKRHKQWADVYADLLQIESKDTSTITLHTVQGIAWAKVAKVPGVPGTASP